MVVMSYPPLLEERYAPDQYGVLVTCIFLNKTEAVRAQSFLQAFLRQYPTAESLRFADPARIQTDYFSTLGLWRRARWLVTMADQLISDPPLPNVLRRKQYANAGPACEVAHLAGVGQYACDAWRLFCKRSFYAANGLTVPDEWRTLRPTDSYLLRYVEGRRQQEQREQARLLEDELLALRLMAIRLADDYVSTQKVVVRSQD
ncbi:MAG: hypothetical protein L6R36_008248, partial [Xanthoria steineri]